MKRPLILAMVLLFLAVLIPLAVQAATFYTESNGTCYQIKSKNIINQYYVIYRCRTCDCKKLIKEETGFQSMAEAMRFLEMKHGELQPR